MPKNKDCVVTDSSLCKWLNKDCENCYVNTMKTDEDREETLKNFEVMLSLLPDDFDELSGEKCQFCKGDKQKKAVYAVTDLGHAEPKTMRGMFFGVGKKVRKRIGSLVPVNIAICKECRRSFRMIEIIKWVSVLVFLAASIPIVSLPFIAERFDTANSFVPYAIVIGGVLIGYVVGKLLTMSYTKAKSKKTHLNIFEIPICAKMKENGWFLVQDSPGVTRFIFSKKPVMQNAGGVKDIKKSMEEDFTQTSFLED